MNFPTTVGADPTGSGMLIPTLIASQTNYIGIPCWSCFNRKYLNRFLLHPQTRTAKMSEVGVHVKYHNTCILVIKVRQPLQ